MPNHRPFGELTATFAPERSARLAAMSRALEAEMTLDALRRALDFSQQDVAATLDVGQPAVARLERRADMRIGSLLRYVEALGGELELTARFGARRVRIDIPDAEAREGE